MKKQLLFVLLLGLIIAGIVLVILDYTEKPKSTTSRGGLGKEFNSVRSRDNIPIIEKEWIIYKQDSLRTVWAYPGRFVRSKEPIHLLKEVSIKDRIIEQDVFHYNMNDTLGYRLIVDHEYREKFVRKRNEFVTYTPGKYPPAFSIDLTDKSADSVLIAWNLSEAP